MPTSDPAVLTNSLFDASLLAATGGLLDALVYLNHGHVFATAMTGNLIFLGIAAISRNWNEIIPISFRLSRSFLAFSPRNICTPGSAFVPSSSAWYWRSRPSSL
jgi:hypothetical protein